MPVSVEKSSGFSGCVKMSATNIADKLIEAKDDHPAAIRVVYASQANREDTASLSVNVDGSSTEKLKPFLINQNAAVPVGEAALREFLKDNLNTDPLYISASGGWVYATVAPPGKHVATLDQLRKYSRSGDGASRIRFILKTKAGEEITWTGPLYITAVRGSKPEDDDIGINLNKSDVNYLIALGLDIQAFTQAMNDAYRSGTLFSRLSLDGQGPGFFDDPGDITPELLRWTQKTARPVMVEMVMNEKYGLGPKRGRFSIVELTPVHVEGSQNASAELQAEQVRFIEDYNNLVRLVFARDDARFMAGDSLTSEARDLIKALIVPVVRAYPDCVTKVKADGTPAINIPPDENWRLNGIVCVNYLAERLMTAEAKVPGTLFQLISLAKPDENKILSWVAANVPEFADVLSDDGGQETF